MYGEGFRREGCRRSAPSAVGQTADGGRKHAPGGPAGQIKARLLNPDAFMLR